ncbi:unnamed protein product [Soboliphyme baturini]|uniref:JmjC domain-containing protein n=1 Tax=Soboliphyme baturini TaxID=241478 RepID=A0A183IN81_9BILA|nr:unnamed protein product [Soboliphyme baturini]
MHETLQPFVLTKAISSWPASKWTPDNLSERFGNKLFKIRLGPLITEPGSITWETSSSYAEVTLANFVHWVEGNVAESGQLANFKKSKYWGYIDYKYMFEWFDADELSEVDWSLFGIENDGLQSTFWIGSAGAHTPCHYDSYGFNLHAQIYGNKRWVLVPPEDSQLMRPTRLPYEESSIFSALDIRHPPAVLKKVSTKAVLLNPGDVLCVPPRWWHFVQCDNTSISVNSWIDIDSDLDFKVTEAATRVLVAIMSDHISSKLIDKSLSLDQDLEVFSDVIALYSTRAKSPNPLKKDLLLKFWDEHASSSAVVPNVSYAQLCEFLSCEQMEEVNENEGPKTYGKEDVISAILQPDVVTSICKHLLKNSK